ncbi:curli production assembly protein CsgF [Oceanisphaera profunda]|uniref:Curli production assembly/transport component CsgF n=1 Tax=Oceanisphaera profunda TaxID=1416627 RepID=A0A1Y0D6F0_9GAMM|nr:curli assembly protein CsgF [Oceanisphaera profunda]ART83123.1 curli production assembly protein CsgF [Oceanisphaera profunda]
MKANMTFTSVGLWLAASFFTSAIQASELVYTPINPTFGGSPLNGSFLLGNAQAQNKYKDPDLEDRVRNNTPTALERFTSQLESRLLSQLLTNIQTGQTGSLTTDAFTINLQDNDGVLTIVITDRLTGEVSEIIVDSF